MDRKSMLEKTSAPCETASHSYPRVVKEEQLPATIGYESIDASTPDFVNVIQFQRFRFVLRTSAATRETVLVDYTLQNDCWQEHANRKLPNPTHGRFPSETRQIISVSQGNREIFFTRTQYGSIHLDQNVIDENFDWKKSHKDGLRRALRIVRACAEQIASSSTIERPFPSVEYLLQDLPPITREYLPNKEEKMAPQPMMFCSWLLPSSRARDRTTKYEFRYQPAVSISAWRSKIPAFGEGVHEYELEDLPWYTRTDIHADSRAHNNRVAQSLNTCKVTPTDDRAAGSGDYASDDEELMMIGSCIIL